MEMRTITSNLTGPPRSLIAYIGKRDTTQEDTADDDDNEEVRNARHANHHPQPLLPHLKIFSNKIVFYSPIHPLQEDTTNILYFLFSLFFLPLYLFDFFIFVLSITVGSIRHGHCCNE
jgi:hypothetical protein